MQTRKIIVVFCHSRAEVLNKCLTSLKKATDIDSWSVNVVHQHGFDSVERVIQKHRKLIDNLIVTKSNFDFPLGNINYNRILGTNFAFEILEADCLLGIEEDSKLSTDTLVFIDFVYNKYKKKKAFRGINLGSIEHGNNVTENSYSLLRSGLQGSAGVITRKTWRGIQRKKLFEFNLADKTIAWDGKIEFYLKSGFMVTPNLSRYLDLGHGGTFAPISKNDPYFLENKKSWYSKNISVITSYQHLQINHRIRFDTVRYRLIHSFVYLLRQNEIIYRWSCSVGVTKLLKKRLIPS